MTYQTLLNLSHIAVAIGIIITALGGYGAFHFQKKIDQEKEKSTELRPIVDLCNRGISVDKINDSSATFNIPYCSGKNANAYNVKLRTAILLKDGDDLKILNDIDEGFPENIILTYETGKSISYILNGFNLKWIKDIYIYVRGSYSNEKETLTFQVSDIFKFSPVTKTWVRLVGEENKKVRKFIELHKMN
tara:strand:- start:1488 stop:2057 length:570 start_codon:yes stop_codon:yes gene_type:complete